MLEHTESWNKIKDWVHQNHQMSSVDKICQSSGQILGLADNWVDKPSH